MSKYKYDAVIWDYNGTLADDVEASLLASNEIIVRHGKEPITMAQYYDYVDYPISRFWEHVFDLDEFPMAKIGEEYYKAYPKYFRGLSDGAAELVKNSIGAFGLIAVAAVCLSPFALFAVRRLLLQLLAAAAEIAAGDRLSKLLNELSSVMGLLLGLIGSYGLMLFFSLVAAIRTVSG